MRRVRHWSLNRLLASMLAVLGALVAALLLLASLQVRAAEVQTEAENRRSASFLIADSLRQSSNDLTNMVRLYVATGQQRYRDYYEEILAIRAGSAPRPRGYDSSFWDRVLAQGDGFVRYGEPQSLIAMMRDARFAPAEFDALAMALQTSNVLARRERAVMGRAAARSGAGSAGDLRREYRQLVDAAYLAEKGRIMRAIGRFTALVDARTLRELRAARSDSRALALAQLGVIALIAILAIAALVVLSRIALRPLARLVASTRRIAAGDYDARVEIDAVSDLEQLAGAFNDMAAAVQTDVAAREAAEHDAVLAREAAEQANRAKTTFLAAMSHEIRTPMIGVTGMLELLGHSDLSRQQRGLLATADSSARSLLQIIGDVLDFSKIEADKLELAAATFDLRAVISAATDMFRHTASAKGLLLTWTVDERLAPAHVGDPLRLRQVVTNLVSNAVKFTEVGGIEVTARLAERVEAVEHVLISVTDTGAGMSREQQQRLFEEFSQGQPTSAQRHRGTGLGLVICRRLAVLMGGDVTAESEPGAGTTMRLRVPLPIGDPAALDAAGAAAGDGLSRNRVKPSRADAEREGSVVLLAEDHPVNRTVIVQQLELVGFHVDVAEDGQQAFERYTTGRYGIVLTDVNMPRMDGYELALALRRHERRTDRRRTPILALSANVMRGEPEKAHAAGMDDFLAKPTTIPFLAAKLRQWLPDVSWEPVVANTAAARSESPIDSAELDLLTGGNEAMSRSVVEDFLATTRGDLEALQDALGGRRAADARRCAHRVKGAALIVGARPLATIAQRLEDECADDAEPDWDAVGALADGLGDALAEVAAYVARGSTAPAGR